MNCGIRLQNFQNTVLTSVHFCRSCRQQTNMASVVTITTPDRKSTNFFDCLKPIRILARIYGLLSFSINLTPNGEIADSQLNPFDIFYAMTHITVCLVCAVLIFVYFTVPNNVWAMIFLSSMEFFLISAILLAAVSIALDIFNRNRLIAMLQKIHQFDEEVNFT